MIMQCYLHYLASQIVNNPWTVFFIQTPISEYTDPYPGKSVVHVCNLWEQVACQRLTGACEPIQGAELNDPRPLSRRLIRPLLYTVYTLYVFRTLPFAYIHCRLIIPEANYVASVLFVVITTNNREDHVIIINVLLIKVSD